MSLKRISNKNFSLIGSTTVTWQIELALNLKILRNYLIDSKFDTVLSILI